ncbi:lantibiotic immunity ABC transporter MutG family permease subunit [Sporosarcina sp. BP05]|uniref:lantibiotic immunity ABC transporter MutG family permease subunit n=1 Tax=Sporosarcina sp. BP05 TaxID=2758726 RepID=UPI001648D64A|nr:lantibiotic immunity ABC transporter MutG family permease subunit [Sporosarcina sp. BP05]
MKQMIHLWRAEQVKIRRTPSVWLHLFIPIAISFLFLWYYGFSQVNFETKWTAFIQLLAISFPFMISVVVSIAVDQERQNGFVSLLAGIPNKNTIIAVKILRLFCWGTFSLACSILIFVTGLKLQNQSSNDVMYFLISTSIIMLTVLLLYFVHWFVDLRFSRNYSIALGLVESLIAAVFMTGLGEGF